MTQEEPIRFGSLCSGIEAASVAWEYLGWKAAWFSEIDSFPNAVLEHHFPDVPNHGDMQSLPGRILNHEVEAPELICGGTPCQAFSVAGLRKSLDDDRGNLSLTYCEIIDACDEVRQKQGLLPTIAFWENVPGVLSTKDNAFGCFLARLIGADAPLCPPSGGGWSSAGYVVGSKRQAAWRILDAQYFGVPQRRRRVFVVASAREGFDPSKVLFERTGMSGDIDEGGEVGLQTSAQTGEGLPLDDRSRILNISHIGRLYNEDEVSQTILAHFGSGGGNTPLVYDTSSEVHKKIFRVLNRYQYAEDGLASTLLARASDKNIVSEPSNRTTPTVYDTSSEVHQRLFKAYKYYQFEEGNIAMALLARDSDNQIVAEPAIGISTFMTRLYGNKSSATYTEQCPTITAKDPHKVLPSDTDLLRRLTPLECERLQGFPDNWTRIPYRGKSAEDCPDYPRYKAVGNSWAVPVARWIGKRIDAHLKGKL